MGDFKGGKSDFLKGISLMANLNFLFLNFLIEGKQGVCTRNVFTTDHALAGAFLNSLKIARGIHFGHFLGFKLF